MKSKAIIVVCAFLATFMVGYFAFFQGGDEVVANQVTAASPDHHGPPGESADQGDVDSRALSSERGDKGGANSSKQGGHSKFSDGAGKADGSSGKSGAAGKFDGSSGKLGGNSGKFSGNANRQGGGDRTVGKLLVYVTGAVASPGLYEVPGRSTVGDVVKAAGGLLRFADTESINLAQGAESGTHIHIPFSFTGTPEELLRAQRLNINTATEEELVSIRGIGPTAAKKIVDYRKEKGNFQSVDDLTKIKGIGPALLKKIRPFITT